MGCCNHRSDGLAPCTKASWWSLLNSDPFLHEVIALVVSAFWSALMWAAIFLWPQPRDKLAALHSAVVKCEYKQSGDLLCARWGYFQAYPQTCSKLMYLVYWKYVIIAEEIVFQAKKKIKKIKKKLKLTSSCTLALWFQFAETDQLVSP